MNRKERFMQKVEIAGVENRFSEIGACWNWIGALSGSGYGQFWNGERNIPAHWFLLDEFPKTGQEACHKCDNRRCVRPSHLFIGTHSDNMQDMLKKGRHNPEARSRGARTMLRVRRSANGEVNHQAKLSNDDVALIKGITKTRGMGAKLARHFKVSETVISGIWKGTRWGQIQPDTQRAEAFLKTIGKWNP